MKRMQAVIAAIARLAWFAPLIAAIGQSPAATLQTLTGPAGTGWSLAPIADVDGDQVDDALVSTALGNSVRGSVSLYSGRTGALIRTMTGPDNGASAGWAVADAGDLNGDGIHDVVTGHPRSGSQRGGAVAFSGANGAVLWQWLGTGSEGFGWAVAGVGDVDADQRDDVLIGNGFNPGRAYLYSGRDGHLIRTFTGDVAGAGFGQGVSGIADLNQDQRPDLLISAPVEGAPATGAIYVFSGADGARLRKITGPVGAVNFGTSFLGDAGDVNGDRVPDVYVGDFSALGGDGRAFVFSGADGSRLHLFQGANGEGLGCGRGAGDVDHDGHADLIIGSYSYSSAGLGARGRMQVFSGRTGAVMQTELGTAAGEQFGFDAASLGDTNNDGRVDFLVGASPVNLARIIRGDVEPQPGFAIGAGMTGAWHDPANPGHGFFIQVLPEQRFLAIWFAFDNGGNQAWFGGVGTYTGNQADLDAQIFSGGRFPPNFNAADVQTRAFGHLQFQFSDCNAGQVRFEPVVAGYAAGTMPLARITQPAGLSCE
ncbi:hypothetical protein C7S18_18195 [Ahniella affigens]|uniref:VCBS repeat-containing protein n=1 Tax=Ahniella affigens TaxID=2021234 RepID=A0A2P1PVW2_9GAMM|nr:VCBS repeat-containing protein [Ahniella affigens]AVP98986.1 hypothetical protein C7S18_18195 [Ahniella affigens]